MKCCFPPKSILVLLKIIDSHNSCSIWNLVKPSSPIRPSKVIQLWNKTQEREILIGTLFLISLFIPSVNEHSESRGCYCLITHNSSSNRIFHKLPKDHFTKFPLSSTFHLEVYDKMPSIWHIRLHSFKIILKGSCGQVVLLQSMHVCVPELPWWLHISSW